MGYVMNKGLTARRGRRFELNLSQLATRNLKLNYSAVLGLIQEVGGDFLGE